jgi:serine protease Do
MLRSLSALTLVFGLALSPLVAMPARADDISKQTIEAVGSATSEVVVLKPKEDNLTYERALPMDLVPYSVRKDPYYSVGTAFAIGPNVWVTAGHVFDFGHKSLSKTYRLRDRNGKVYDIDQILKYSMHRDFVVFSVKNAPDVKPLATNTAPRMNEKVYSVGNALGEGVVFRDGLFTSMTPEEDYGDWKWIRFSAAASPGNSGGPLLDSDGKVIGVIIGKSENENLNYALPISEVLKAKDHVADLDARVVYKIDNMPNDSGTARIQKKITLPMSYEKLDALLTQDLYDFGMKVQNDFWAERKDHTFPNGKESLPLLYTDNSTIIPGLIARGDDGIWDSYTPSKPNSSDIGENGGFTYGSVGSSDFFYFHAPDGMKTSALYGDSKLLMDTFLQGYPLYRTVASQRIKVTSMGKAAQEYTYTDHYGRKWVVRMWNIDYADEQLVVFALPVPGGMAGMIRVTPVSQMESNIDDLKLLADFTSIAYYGTLADWRDFLAQRDLLPEAFSGIKIDFDYGKSFHYASQRVDFSYGPEEMHITDKSDLKLKFAYFKDGGKTVWDVSQIVTGDSKDTSTFFTVVRHMQPPKQLDDKFQSNWEKITQRQYPFNNLAFFDNKRTLIGDIYPRNVPAGKLSSAKVVYSAFYGADGNLNQKMVQTKLDEFMDKMKVFENRF